MLNIPEVSLEKVDGVDIFSLIGKDFFLPVVSKDGDYSSIIERIAKCMTVGIMYYENNSSFPEVGTKGKSKAQIAEEVNNKMINDIKKHYGDKYNEEKERVFKNVLEKLKQLTK